MGASFQYVQPSSTEPRANFLIQIARFHNLFNETPALDLADDLSAEDQDQAWRTWASNEEMRR